MTEEKLKFVVIDKLTGKLPDMESIALKEIWAKRLVYCDMDSFAITQDGALILMDECGAYADCPKDRFEVKYL